VYSCLIAGAESFARRRSEGPFCPAECVNGEVIEFGFYSDETMMYVGSLNVQDYIGQ